MTPITVQDILKKINYIEADLEIQKQILFGLGEDQKEDIEKTIELIAEKKGEIAQLREQIKAIDPEEYERIIILEKAVITFREMASQKTFTTIDSREPGKPCALTLNDGSVIECIVKASEENGDWTVITLGGEVLSYASEQVQIDD